MLALAIALCTGAHAQNNADQMKAWQAYMTPGDVHKMLAKSDGKWNVESIVWMDPSQPPQKSKATCVNSMVLGGRYQLSEVKGTMMGQPFEGRNTLAYDNAKHTFIDTWIDNMGTGVMTVEGTWDEATKRINFAGKMVDPTSGNDLPVREVFTMKDADHQMMEMFVSGPDGKEFKTMELQYTRAGKKG